MDIIRSYTRDVQRIVNSIARFGHQVTDLSSGQLAYPLYYIVGGRGDQHVLITGGVHGDEPAGTYAALDLLLDPQTENYFSEFTLHVFPCMNPWGYERHTRENAETIDLNRGFKESIEGTECKLFAKKLGELDLKYTFTMDMHEGSQSAEWKDFALSENPNGAWLYESCRDHSIRMGRPMIEAVRKEFDVCDFDMVYDDVCSDGLISYPEDMKSADYATQDSFDAFLWKHYTEQSFTAETIEDWPMEDRVRAHHLLFFKALDCVSFR